jgi:hypothetical protein
LDHRRWREKVYFVTGADYHRVSRIRRLRSQRGVHVDEALTGADAPRQHDDRPITKRVLHSGRLLMERDECRLSPNLSIDELIVGDGSCRSR